MSDNGFINKTAEKTREGEEGVKLSEHSLNNMQGQGSKTGRQR